MQIDDPDDWNRKESSDQFIRLLKEVDDNAKDSPRVEYRNANSYSKIL